MSDVLRLPIETVCMCAIVFLVVNALSVLVLNRAFKCRSGKKNSPENQDFTFTCPSVTALLNRQR